MQKITPFLWYVSEAEEAARFYASIFPDSSVDAVNAMPTDSPSGPAGSVSVVQFTLFGQSFMAMSAGPHDPFNDAVSLYVDCADQAEVDRYWDALEANGGKPQACGWIRDRYGVRWQIVPRFLTESMMNPNPVRGKRVADAMMKMVKLDEATLRAAADAA